MPSQSKKATTELSQDELSQDLGASQATENLCLNNQEQNSRFTVPQDAGSGELLVPGLPNLSSCFESCYPLAPYQPMVTMLNFLEICMKYLLLKIAE